MSSLRFAVALPDLPGFQADAVLGDSVFEVLIEPRDLRRLRASLMDIARTYNLGYAELIAANPGVDPWLPGLGTRILLPTAHVLPDAPRQGIVVNLSDQRIYWFTGAGQPIRTCDLALTYWTCE